MLFGHFQCVCFGGSGSTNAYCEYCCQCWPELCLHNNEPVSSGFWKGLGFRVPALYHGQFLNMLVFTVSCLAPHLQIHMYVHCTGAFASCSMYACRQAVCEGFPCVPGEILAGKERIHEAIWRILENPAFLHWCRRWSCTRRQCKSSCINCILAAGAQFVKPNNRNLWYLWWCSNSISLMMIKQYLFDGDHGVFNIGIATSTGATATDQRLCTWHYRKGNWGANTELAGRRETLASRYSRGWEYK